MRWEVTFDPRDISLNTAPMSLASVFDDAPLLGRGGGGGPLSKFGRGGGGGGAVEAPTGGVLDGG